MYNMAALLDNNNISLYLVNFEIFFSDDKRNLTLEVRHKRLQML